MSENSAHPTRRGSATLSLESERIGGLIILGAVVGGVVGLFVGWKWGVLSGVIAFLAVSLLEYFKTYQDQVLPERPVAEATVQKRNHIICLDGTFNDPKDEEKQTNVYKLYDALQKDEHQIKRYYPGVGTRELFGVESEDVKKWFSVNYFGGAIAIGRFGAKGILQRAYFDFVKAYRPGDQIFIFGFSRGAATARALANYICKTSGLPRRVDIRYMKSSLDTHPVLRLEVTGEHEMGTPEVKFLGLWDTVGAMGNPYNKRELRGFDLTIHARVKQVCHLVALDEQRKSFNVTLIDQEERVDGIEEVWFPGWHSNVGGGLKDKRLSDIALRYMMRCATGSGARFKEEPASKEAPTDYGLTGDFANILWKPARLWRRKAPRKVEALRKGAVPKIHESAYYFRKIYAQGDELLKLPEEPKSAEKIKGYGE